MTSLGLRSYVYREYTDSPTCEAIRYSRGFFSSLPNDENCGTFFGDPNGNAQPITDEVRADIERLKAALAEGARSFEYIQIEKSDGAIGAGSWFAADGCTTYFYDPNWTSLPESNSKVLSKAITRNWYAMDFCP